MKKNGLLLVNLGTPEAPTPEAVKRYLNAFLGDPNVITMPAVIWRPILKGMVLPFRSSHSAAMYRDIWLKEGSPQIVYSQRLAKAVQIDLPDWDVRLAMTYGQPAIKETLSAMLATGEQVIVMSLFPHFTQSSAQSIIEQVHTVDPTIPIIDRFADESAYLKLLAQHVQTAWRKKQYDRLIIAYHGIPAAMVKHGDPYQEETERTTKRLRQLLEIPDQQIEMAYQSKFGPMPWLKPYLRKVLKREAHIGTKDILLVVPSFVTDCLETLEEDGVQNRQFFREQGGHDLDLVPALNDQPAFAQFIADLIQKKANK